MTPYDFQSISHMFVSTDLTRKTLCESFFYHNNFFATDGAIALCVSSVDTHPFPSTTNQKQIGVAKRLFNDYIQPCESFVGSGQYVRFSLSYLPGAVSLAFASVQSDVMFLRACDYESDSCPPTFRDVYHAFTSVILGNSARSVISGYYGSLLAGLHKEYGPANCFSHPRDPHKPLYFRAYNWRLVIMPLRVDPGSFDADRFSGRVVADAIPGTVVRDRCMRKNNIDDLRKMFGNPSAIYYS